MNVPGPFSGASANNETKFSDSISKEQIYFAAADSPVNNKSPPNGIDESPCSTFSFDPYANIISPYDALCLAEEINRALDVNRMRLGLIEFQAQLAIQETQQQLEVCEQIGEQLKKEKENTEKYNPRRSKTVFRGPSVPEPRIVPLRPEVYWRDTNGIMQQAHSRREARKRRFQEELLREENDWMKDVFTES